jgi:general secretion pathway protein D
MPAPATATAAAVTMPLATGDVIRPAAASPEQLQQQAVAALAQTDYTAAQTLALRSWRQGTRHGSLCAENWRVIGEARGHLQDPAGVATARKWVMQCVAPVQPQERGQ